MHKRHFLEGIAAQASLLVAQHEVPAGFHIGDFGQEGRGGRGVAIRVHPRPAIEGCQVGGVERGGSVRLRFEGCIVPTEARDDGIEDQRTRSVAPQQLAQRHGIGSIAVELRLVDVHSATDDATSDAAAAQLILYQDAADLAVAHVDVVGPLDRDRIRATFREGLLPVKKRAQGIADGKGDGLAEQEQPRRRQEGGMQQQAEEYQSFHQGLDPAL